ncbi:GTP-binding protein [Pyrus ussuriensis x Pyrus communis]|uniref:GTP-binding protein n=1 Tax=Pyrus ussuriensis x Pyrus communis TaxID=2448454 RepID=A0A5N5HTB5_9ROSA|nr:GTP-binding protein [Pyrus ussuriensis x Pyrus communis]
MDWSAFTKGFFWNRHTLVTVLLLVDSSVPPQKTVLDYANLLGRNNIPMTFVFTKCDKMRAGKGKRADENLRDFQQFIKENYRVRTSPWIMTSSFHFFVLTVAVTRYRKLSGRIPRLKINILMNSTWSYLPLSPTEGQGVIGLVLALSPKTVGIDSHPLVCSGRSFEKLLWRQISIIVTLVAVMVTDLQDSDCIVHLYPSGQGGNIKVNGDHNIAF